MYIYSILYFLNKVGFSLKLHILCFFISFQYYYICHEKHSYSTASHLATNPGYFPASVIVIHQDKHEVFTDDEQTNVHLFWRKLFLLYVDLGVSLSLKKKILSILFLIGDISHDSLCISNSCQLLVSGWSVFFFYIKLPVVSLVYTVVQ